MQKHAKRAKKNKKNCTCAPAISNLYLLNLFTFFGLYEFLYFSILYFTCFILFCYFVLISGAGEFFFVLLYFYCFAFLRFCSFCVWIAGVFLTFWHTNFHEKSGLCSSKNKWQLELCGFELIQSKSKSNPFNLDFDWIWIQNF